MDDQYGLQALVANVDNVRELPVGKYDAVRTLRHLLQKAERGEITEVLVVYQKKDETDCGEQELQVYWSEMIRYDVLWMTRWLNSWVNNRYFALYHTDEEEDDVG